VLADYAHAKQQMELLQEEQVKQAWKDYNTKTLQAATLQQQEEMKRQEQEEIEGMLSSDEDNDDEDDEFMREYRLKRIAELKQEQIQRMKDA
jgi:hypothetical protein